MTLDTFKWKTKLKAKQRILYDKVRYVLDQINETSEVKVNDKPFEEGIFPWDAASCRMFNNECFTL